MKNENGMFDHKCCECKFMHTFQDSGNRTVAVCAFDQSMYYLEEVGFCTDDCELDDWQEEIWQRSNED